MAGPSEPPRLQTVRAYRSPAAWATLLVVLALGLTIDLSAKQWTFKNVADQPIELDRQAIVANPNSNPIPHHDGRHLLGAGLLDLRLVINRGAVFGVGNNRRVFFIAFTLAALGAGLLVFSRWTSHRHHLAHVAIGLILAGGIGNLYDRIRFAVVRDFLHMLPGYELPFGWSWPGGSEEVFPWVFNTADVMLLIGMGSLMLHINRVEKRRKLEQEAAEKSPETASEPAESRRGPPLFSRGSQSRAGGPNGTAAPTTPSDR
ncbi:MAG: signal peptidase II [Planctomycetota bacterium]